MDDNLPKEGELLDISQNKKSVSTPTTLLATEEKPPSHAPVWIVSILVILTVIAFVSNAGSNKKVDPQVLNTYQQNTASVFDTMKSQFPYLTNVVCEGSDPNKADCVHFVGTFRPNKDNPLFITTMATSDKVEGSTDADIELIKDHVKVLADNKRTILGSRELFTFLVDSVTIPKVGEEFHVKTKCSESDANTVTCEKQR